MSELMKSIEGVKCSEVFDFTKVSFPASWSDKMVLVGGRAIRSYDLLVEENQRLTTDRQNAISLMSKSWRHDSENQDDLMTRYVTMAENQFKKKGEEIDRLTVIATKHATRCDELYGALMTIRHIANKTPDKPQDDITIDDVRLIDNAMQKIFDLSDEVLDKSRTEADK